MTSGNLSDEPICYDDADARRRLGRDRRRAGSSTTVRSTCPATTRSSGSTTGEELPIRRSRGYAPLPVRLPSTSPPVLATGGELKNTFCLASGRDAWMSQHIGDMGSLETLAAFERSTAQFADLYQVEPGPGRRRRPPRLPDPALGRGRAPATGRRWSSTTTPTSPRSWPSTACPPASGSSASPSTAPATAPTAPSGAARSWWPATTGSSGPPTCATSPLPGGDATIRKPYRAALAHLWAAGIDWAPDLAPVRAAAGDGAGGARAPARAGRRLRADLEHGPAVRRRQLAPRACATPSPTRPRPPSSSRRWPPAPRRRRRPTTASPWPGDEIDPAPVLRAIVADLRDGVGRRARSPPGFHLAVARLIGRRRPSELRRDDRDRPGGAERGGVPERPARPPGPGRAGPTRPAGAHPSVVPPNDGGLALGRSAVAGHRAAGRSA